MNSTETAPPCPQKSYLGGYYLCLYFIFLLTTIGYVFSVQQWSCTSTSLVICTILFYPILYLLPTGLITFLSTILCIPVKNQKIKLITTASLTGLSAGISHLLLLAGAGLYYRYGYHFYSMHIIDLFSNPDGFAAMGIRTSAIITFIFIIVLIIIAHIFLEIWFIRKNPISIPWEKKWFLGSILIPIIAFPISLGIYSFAHFNMNPPPLLTSDCFPFFIPCTASGIYKTLGFKKPNRDTIRLHLQQGETRLSSYPQNPIQRIEHKKYNIVWMACESLPAQMFTKEIMPNLWNFSNNGVRFERHYSGGNVTRQAVFSMFYAIPASYWPAFLKACRGPLFIDWLKDDGYTFDCFTSAKFTYPEFDKTVFFEIPTANLHSDDAGMTWERDRRNVERLINSINDGVALNKPFFRFMFFESPHNPYEFPPDAIIRKDYLDPFNEVLAVKANAEKIRARAVNASHHLDQQLGRVFKHLEKCNLLDNTIVIVAGDHGEEFFEKGYLGHSSAFVEEQIRTPLVIYVPKEKPQIYKAMSSHLDIVPMLAKYLGITNQPEDYSTGFDLLGPNAPLRRYSVIANWHDVFFAGVKYKSLVPLDAYSYARQIITDPNDNPLENVEPFYKEYEKDLKMLQNDLTRFTTPNRANP